MEMRISILQKIAYCVFLFTFIGKLHAQIVYTDIPDATPNATYALDLNNDLVDDFLIQFQMTNMVVCIPQNNNAYAGNLIGNIHSPWALPGSFSVCDSLTTWYDSSNPGTLAYETTFGNWVGETDKYLALKLLVGTDIYYGWARLDVLANSTSFTVKDFAYESAPNTCIETGQVTTGITEKRDTDIFSIFPNPFNYLTSLNFGAYFNELTLIIFDSFGQIKKELNGISGKSITMLRGDLPNGIYFVQLTQGNNIIALEKLVITD